MPNVKPGESRADYVKRCIPVVVGEGSTPEQAAGKCNGMYDQAQKDEAEKACGKRKPRKGEQVFDQTGFVQAVPTDLGEIQTVSVGQYPEVPEIDLPDHLKPAHLRPREIDMLKQP